MAVTVRQAEGVPAAYPVLDPAVGAEVWQRIESYIAHRYSARDIEWIVEGPGEWHPPLAPATISTVEIWTGSGWDDCTPDASPLGGYVLSGCGPYRFTGTVGVDDADVPASVATAAHRLSDYMTAKPSTPGATSESTRAGSVETSKSRDAAWMANAMQNSGAADLLRTYRKV